MVRQCSHHAVPRRAWALQADSHRGGSFDRMGLRVPPRGPIDRRQPGRCWATAAPWPPVPSQEPFDAWRWCEPQIPDARVGVRAARRSFGIPGGTAAERQDTAAANASDHGRGERQGTAAAANASQQRPQPPATRIRQSDIRGHPWRVATSRRGSRGYGKRSSLRRMTTSRVTDPSPAGKRAPRIRPAGGGWSCRRPAPRPRPAGRRRRRPSPA